MVDIPNTSASTRPTSSPRSLRRPGWGLIQDVHPKQPSALRSMTPAPIAPQRHDAPPTALVPATQRTRQGIWKRITSLLRNYLFVLLSPLAIAVSIGLSTLPVVGIGTIGVYALCAFIFKIPSRVTFWLATMVLVGIATEFLLLPGIGKVDQSAFFVFLLLCIGLASLVLENRRHTPPRESSFGI